MIGGVAPSRVDSPLRAPLVVGVLFAVLGSGLAAHWLLQPAGAQLMPHGMCFLWSPNLIWLNVIADGAIACAYVAIAAGLFHLVVQNRQRLPYRWVFVAFAMFILSCAGSHIMEVVTLWSPVYWLSTDVKLLSALVSTITAFIFPVVVMRAPS